MKIIIEHGNKKREIVGAFNICGSLADLQELQQQLKNELERRQFVYGWVNIVEGRQLSVVDTPPEPWE
jgi:Zn-finger domain-containing protein